MHISKGNLCSSQLEYKTLIQFIPEIFLIKLLLDSFGENFHFDPIKGQLAYFLFLLLMVLHSIYIYL